MTFSVIIPTHNRPSQLQVAVKSVLDQQESNFEILIINDSSIQNYNDIKAKLTGHDKIRYFEVDYGNRSMTRNFGIDRAKGDYICFLDDDDIYYDCHLSTFKVFLDLNPEAQFLHSYSIVRKENNMSKDRIGNVTFQGPNRVVEEPFTINSVCIYGKLIKAEKFNENLHYWEDKELWIRLSLVTEIHSLPVYTNEYIKHGNNTVNFSNLKSMEDRQVAIKYIKRKYSGLDRNWINKQLRGQFDNLHNLYLNNNKVFKAIITYIQMNMEFPDLIIRRHTLSSIKRWGMKLMNF